MDVVGGEEGWVLPPAPWKVERGGGCGAGGEEEEEEEKRDEMGGGLGASFVCSFCCPGSCLPLSCPAEAGSSAEYEAGSETRSVGVYERERCPPCGSTP